MTWLAFARTVLIVFVSVVLLAVALGSLATAVLFKPRQEATRAAWLFYYFGEALAWASVAAILLLLVAGAVRVALLVFGPAP